MANQDFTTYLNFLGKEVCFLEPFNHTSCPVDSYRIVEGFINGIVLFDNCPADTEFFVEDSTYAFSDVIFIDKLPLDNLERVEP